MQPTVRSESIRMMSCASLDTCTSRAKQYADGVASTMALGHPYNSLCFPWDARWSEVVAEIRAMRFEVPCELSSVVAAFLPTRLGALQEDIRGSALSECFELGNDSITFHKKGVPYGIVRFTTNSTRRKPAAMCKEGMLLDLFAMFCCDPAWDSVFQNLQVQLDSSYVNKSGHLMELPLSEVDGSCTSFPIAKRFSTIRKACYMLEFNKKGFPYGQVLICPDRPLPRTRKPVTLVPSTVAAVSQPTKPVKPDFPSVKQTLHALMMNDFMGEILHVQLEYASCAATIRPEEEKTTLEQFTATSREPNRGK